MTADEAHIKALKARGHYWCPECRGWKHRSGGIPAWVEELLDGEITSSRDDTGPDR